MSFLNLCALRCLCSPNGRFLCLGSLWDSSWEGYTASCWKKREKRLFVSLCVSIQMHKTILINKEVSGARDVMHKEKQCAGLSPAQLHKSVSMLIILLVLYSHREWVFLALISEIYPRETLPHREKTHSGFCWRRKLHFHSPPAMQTDLDTFRHVYSLQARSCCQACFSAPHITPVMEKKTWKGNNRTQEKKKAEYECWLSY